MEKENHHKYDWIALKQKFFNSEILEASAFLRQEIGKQQDSDGNVARNTKGWTEDKKIWKQKRLDRIQEGADKKLIEKLKISLEDLLLNKRLLFSLDAKFLEISGKMVSKDEEGNPKEITDEEKKFFKYYGDNLRDIYQRLQVELGLPTNVKKLKIKGEGLFDLSDDEKELLNRAIKFAGGNKDEEK